VSTATAIAHPNIALVKYWGKRDIPLNLPAVSSISLTLSGFHTHTTVTWGAAADRVHLGDDAAPTKFASKVLAFLDRLDADRPPVEVHTRNDFPTGAGLASSASGFAALALAASAAKGDELDLTKLSVLARQGSGSACRSLWGGFVEWTRGERADGLDSHGIPLAGADHWDLAMVVGVVSLGAKAVGSTEGMERSRLTSPLYDTWVRQAEDDVTEAREAIAARDLPRLGRVMEASTFKMHAAMHTADPPLQYWAPGSVACQHAIWNLRAAGTGAWVTMDAGPQVKVLCERKDAEAVAAAMRPHTAEVHILGSGGPARLA
jgi:diphosphomevalonate decarboxylase